MSLIFVIVFLVASFSIYDFVDSRNWQSATSSLRNKLIFEHRNKRYGAYNIRTDYNNTMTVIILLFSIALFIITLLGFTFRTTVHDLPISYVDTTLMTLEAPPLEEIKTLETPYKIVGGGGGGSAGAASDARIDKTPEEETKKEDVQKESDVHKQSGNSIKTTGDNNTNPNTTLIKGKNPFGGGAQHGEGAGIFGRDSGPGSGVGTGNGINGQNGGTGGGGARKKLTSLNPDDIQSNEDCTVQLTVFINAEGNVIRAEKISNQTTTANSQLISQLINLVKQQIRYDKRPGTALQKQVLTIKVKAS
jgi:hypothetical protein